MITPRTPMRAEVKPLEKVFLSNHEAAAYLGISTETLKKWRATGVIGYYKIDKNIWYEKTEIDKLIKNARQ